MLVLSWVEDNHQALEKFKNSNETNRPKIYTSSSKVARDLLRNPKRITGSDIHIDASDIENFSAMDLSFIYMDGMRNQEYAKERVQIILYLKKF